MNDRKSTSSTLGEMLRREREAAKLPLRLVGEETGIDLSLLGKIERNERQPTKEQIQLLAAFYGMDEDTIHREAVVNQVVEIIMREEADPDILKIAYKKIGQFKSTQDAG